jgi:hypothetical protein
LFASLLEQLGGIDMLEQLQCHENQSVYKLTVFILSEFYEEECIMLDEDEASQNQPSGSFDF